MLQGFNLHPYCGLICGDAVMINTKNDFLDIRPRLMPSKKIKYFSSEETKKLYLNIDNFILTGSSLLKKTLLISSKNLTLN